VPGGEARVHRGPPDRRLRRRGDPRLSNAPAGSLTAHDVVDRVFREESGRAVATLIRVLRDFDLAEEAVQDAFTRALEVWPAEGVPANPGAWITTTARNRAIDRLRRRRTLAEKTEALAREARAEAALDRGMARIGGEEAMETDGIDDRLRLIFTCCHPALAPEARVALTLRLLGGLTVAEIATAFLVPETTMAQRITRAKRKVAGAHIPYRVPGLADLPVRLDGVLAVLFLVFNEGYWATSGEAPVRRELAAEAIRLARVLRGLLPDEPEVAGLLALLLLTDARRDSRFAGGELVPLGEQDRAGWDRDEIAEGHGLVRECLARARATGTAPGRYQLLAAVNAVHTDAPEARDTDWSQVAALYDQLVVLDPSPVVRLNRAVALAELDGPAVALAEVDRLAGPAMAGYHAWHATRADLLRRLGRTGEARAAYDAAIGCAGNPAERAFLARRRDTLVPSPGTP
jgi:RNA polymerase sigma-70 factor (ECF subfamily)